MLKHPRRKSHPLKEFKNWPVQFKYSLILTLISGFTSLLMIFVMAWFIQRNYNLFMGDELGVSPQVIQIVRREQKLLEMWLLILFLFSTTVMFFATLIVMRRLIAPIAVLQRQLWLYSNGNWSHDLRLRDQDEFRGFEVVVNRIRENHLKNIYLNEAQKKATEA